MRFARLISIAIAALALCAPTASAAKQTTKKSMWGPVTLNGKSAFPIYKDLGVKIFQTSLRWHDVASRRPVLAANPKDPAYRWSATLDYAVRQARRNKIRVLVSVSGTPAWANGGKDPRWAPTRAKDFANFMKAASRRYPYVGYWMIWGEPMRQDNFMPIRHEKRGRKLNRKQRRGPQRYAQLLDAAYGAIKGVRRRDKVVGGNTFTTGDISAKNWVRYMRLPGGRRARMDYWGHNPFGPRKPDLSDPALGSGFADFGTLDTMARWLDRWQRRGIKLFLSEYTLPTDHANHEFNFYAPRRVQAQFATAALRIARRWKRIYTLGWHALTDEPPNGRNGGHGNETHRGLMTHDGKRKRAYRAFKRG